MLFDLNKYLKKIITKKEISKDFNPIELIDRYILIQNDGPIKTSKKPNNCNIKFLMNFINNDIVIPNIGKSYVKTWAPLAMTFFVFILTCNLLGLIPFFEKLTLFGAGGSTVTANFGVTVGLAIITFFAIIIAGVKKHGFFGYW